MATMIERSASTHKARFALIRQVLMDQWDPLGVNGIAAAADEYDAYIPGLQRLVAERTPAAGLAEHLDSIQTREMGISPLRDKSRRAAEMLAALHE